MEHRYTYEALPPRHIRLLKLKKNPADHKLQGTIVLCNLDHPSRYEALS
jgi:hypothetical protein